MADTGEQNEPMMSGSGDAADEEKAAGIIQQTEADFSGRDADEVAAVLRERYEASGLPYDPHDLRNEAERISGL